MEPYFFTMFNSIQKNIPVKSKKIGKNIKEIDFFEVRCVARKRLN